jgi:hypothetical protein
MFSLKDGRRLRNQITYNRANIIDYYESLRSLRTIIITITKGSPYHKYLVTRVYNDADAPLAVLAFGLLAFIVCNETHLTYARGTQIYEALENLSAKFSFTIGFIFNTVTPLESKFKTYSNYLRLGPHYLAHSGGYLLKKSSTQSPDHLYTSTEFVRAGPFFPNLATRRRSLLLTLGMNGSNSTTRRRRTSTTCMLASVVTPTLPTRTA